MNKSIFNVVGVVAVATVLCVGCTAVDEEEDGEGKTSNSAISLPEYDYVDGAITSANKEQWFKFTASASTHYILVYHGTLSDFYVQLYDANKNTVGNINDYHEYQLNGFGGWYTEITVTRGKVYYLKVTPYYSSSYGTYRIACRNTLLSPESMDTAKVLYFDTWVSGSITDDDNDDNFYKFTAKSATTHYIHINFGTLTQADVRLYDSRGSILENRTTLSISGYIPYQYLTNGSVYYVAIWSTSNTGTYQVALNTSTTAPE